MDPASDEWGEPDRPGGWLPDMPPKAIMGNADLQEFLTSKATNPGDKRDYTAWDIARRKSSARSVTVEPKAIPT